MGNKRIFGAAGGVVGLGSVAATLGACCAAPWTVGVFGVSGAILLARLSPYQPYLLVIGAVLLGLAFYWAYRPSPACADDGCEARSRNRLRGVVWITALLFAVGVAIHFSH